MKKLFIITLKGIIINVFLFILLFSILLVVCSCEKEPIINLVKNDTIEIDTTEAVNEKAVLELFYSNGIYACRADIDTNFIRIDSLIFNNYYVDTINIKSSYTFEFDVTDEIVEYNFKIKSSCYATAIMKLSYKDITRTSTVNFKDSIICSIEISSFRLDI